MRKRLLFSLCLNKTFSGHNKIWGAQNKFGGHCPQMLPVWLRGLPTTYNQETKVTAAVPTNFQGMQSMINAIDL